MEGEKKKDLPQQLHEQEEFFHSLEVHEGETLWVM